MNLDLSETFTTIKDRAFFYIAGPDSGRFLNGQITQDIKKASDSQAVLTCVTNAKGKLQGIGFIRAYQDGYLMDCPISLRQTLFLRLDMYLIADDAELTDISDDITMHHSFSSDQTADGWACNRYGTPGRDLLSLPEKPQASAQDLEIVRISNRVPAWGAELNEGLLPPEARLEQAAISYSKGCYTGQEVISRIKSSGKVNQSLTAFELSSEVPLPASIPPPDNPEAKPAGTITSLCKHEEKWIGLGFLHRKHSKQKQFLIQSTEVNVLP